MYRKLIRYKDCVNFNRPFTKGFTKGWTMLSHIGSTFYKKITHIGIALQQVKQLLIHLLKLGPDMGKPNTTAHKCPQIITNVITSGPKQITNDPQKSNQR